MNETLDGRTALVTGAGRGIGFAIASALSERGANVALVDVAQLRDQVGPEVWIDAGIADEILMMGPAERIRGAVKDLLQSGAMGDGRLSLGVGDMPRGIPLEHYEVLYESVKEFGVYGK